jgi:hypothetical protein
LFIFPDALMAAARMEFPAEESVQAIHKYVQHHPEVELQKWEPQVRDTTHTTIPSLNAAA